MTNTEMIEYIYKLSVFELLDYVVDNPTDLTDSYYAEFGDAIRVRLEELRNEQTTT